MESASAKLCLKYPSLAEATQTKLQEAKDNWEHLEDLTSSRWDSCHCHVIVNMHSLHLRHMTSPGPYYPVDGLPSSVITFSFSSLVVNQTVSKVLLALHLCYISHLPPSTSVLMLSVSSVLSVIVVLSQHSAPNQAPVIVSS